MVQLSKTSLPFMIDIHCKQECEQLEIRPISFSTFFKGLSAGNFKIMAQKAGLSYLHKTWRGVFHPGRYAANSFR